MRANMSKAIRLLPERKRLRHKVTQGTASPEDAARLELITDQLLESVVNELRHVAEDASQALIRANQRC